MLDNFWFRILQSDYFYNFCNLNYHFDSCQWWMYLRDQLQIEHVFGFLLEFVWKPHFNLSLYWFSDMFVHFFFKFWYFELRFDYFFNKSQYFLLQYYYWFLLFISEIIIFTDFVYIFIYLVDLLFLVIIRQPKYLGGARVCAFDLFFYTRFLYGFFT